MLSDIFKFFRSVLFKIFLELDNYINKGEIMIIFTLDGIILFLEKIGMFIGVGENISGIFYLLISFIEGFFSGLFDGF